MTEWTLDTLRADMIARLEALDGKYSRLREDTLARLAALDEKHNARADGADRAITKAETAAEKRFEGVNEFRSTLADQQRTLMPRTEAEIRLTEVDKNVGELKSRLTTIESKSRGFSGGYGIAMGVVGLIAAVVAIILNLTRAE